MDDTVQTRLTKARKLIQEAHDVIAAIPSGAAREHHRDTAGTLTAMVLPGLDLLTKTISGLLKDGPQPYSADLAPPVKP